MLSLAYNNTDDAPAAVSDDKSKNGDSMGIDLDNPENFDMDGFLKPHLHKLIILGGTFPFSGYISDLNKAKQIITTTLTTKPYNLHLQSVNILITILEMARCDLSLKIKIDLELTSGDTPYLSFMERLMVSDRRTFSKHFIPIGNKAESATQRGKVSPLSFGDKYFLYVRGRGANQSCFYLNYNKLNSLGAELGFVSWNSVNHKSHGIKTLLPCK